MTARAVIAPPRKQKITTEGGKYYYDAAAAQHAIEFFEKQTFHVDGQWAGQPFRLEKWQREEIIGPAFGWKRKSDGLRRFRKIYIEIPKKNGKSGICSRLALYLTGPDGEPGAEVYSAATDKEQAKIVHGEAEDIVKASPGLGKFFKLVNKAISFPLFHGIYRAVSKETASKHGIKPHAIIFDELHALKRPELFDILTNGTMATRQQPMLIIITTAGTDRTSVCWQEHQYALDVLSGKVKDDKILVVIYAADLEDDWQDKRVWKKANPNLGVTFTMESLEDEFNRALAIPRLRNQFKQLRLNLWTSSACTWLPEEVWRACAGVVDPEELRGRGCIGGLDLSSTKDLSAVVLLFEMEDGIRLLPHFFMPKENIKEREHMDAVMYETWAKNGHITLTEGNVIDYDAILSYLVEAKELYDLKEVGYDPYNAGKIVQDLERKEIKMVPVTQGYKLSAAAKEFERQVLSRRLVHGDNPVLNWMASCTEAITDSQDNIKLTKAHGQNKTMKRIDGIIASVIAIDRMNKQDNEDTDSAYEKRGVRVLR